MKYKCLRSSIRSFINQKLNSAYLHSRLLYFCSRDAVPLNKISTPKPSRTSWENHFIYGRKKYLEQERRVKKNIFYGCRVKIYERRKKMNYYWRYQEKSRFMIKGFIFIRIREHFLILCLMVFGKRCRIGLLFYRYWLGELS